MNSDSTVICYLQHRRNPMGRIVQSLAIQFGSNNADFGHGSRIVTRSREGISRLHNPLSLPHFTPSKTSRYVIA